MRRGTIVGLVALLALGCDTGGDDPDLADSGTATDGGLPIGPVEVPDDTVVLTVQPSGVETAVATLGDDGIARFYSESRQAYWEYAIAHEDDASAVDPATEVHVALGADGSTSYFVWDPSGETMPTAWSATLPGSGAHTVDVDPLALAAMDSTVVDYAEMPTDPFGAFTIAGISVSISIQGIARSLVSGAVVSAFGNLVGGACNLVAPLHEEVCEVIVTVAELMANLVAPGFKLARGAITVGAFATAAAGEVWDVFAEHACMEGGVAIGKAMNETNEAQTVALRDSFRRAVGEYHYLLHQLETDPPEDPADRAAMRSVLVDVGTQLSTIGPQVRQGYVEIFDLSGPRPSTDPSPHNRVRTVTEKIIDNTTLGTIEWETVITDELAQAMFGPLPTGGVVLVDVPVGRIAVSQETVRELDVSIAGDIADCLVSVWEGIEGEISDGTTQRMASLEMPVFYQQAVNVALAANQELYDRHYGGGSIPVPCTFDEFEPNRTWEQAVASPASISVGSGPVWLRDLTLCTVEGTPIEEDWYAFPMGAIEFNVQARVREAENEAFRTQYASGADEPVCVDVYYYGQTNELADAPPTHLYGACGTAADTWSGSAGVRRAIGEAWSYILVHVRAEPGAMDAVGYDLGFAE